MAEREDQHLGGAEDGGDTDGHRLLRDLVDIALEEAGIHQERVVGEVHDAGAGLQGGERFVEGEVAVFADAAEEEVDAARRHDGGLVGLALGLQVGGVAVEEVDVLPRDVDVVEQVLVHEAVVAFRVLDRQADVFVHVEGDDVPEGKLAGLVHADQLGVGLDRGGAGREAEDEGFGGPGGFRTDRIRDVACGPQGRLMLVVSDNDVHMLSVQ